ncbi:hypothetical protein ACS0TY_002967 [Phlomoides rotata]
MSDRDRCRADDSGGADGEDGEGPAEEKGPEKEKCKGCERKGKKTSFFRLRKSKKVRHQKQKGVYVNSGCWGGGGLCCFCVKQPTTLDSPGESPSSDPNSSEFTFDMLRALIEKNEFYSKECNPHLDADDGFVKENTNNKK